MLITVSGPPGSGTSTAAAGLADTFDLEHVSGGDIFRELAAERELSLEAFGELAEEDDSIDRNLDARLQAVARERDDIVLESRLAGWMAGEAATLRVWLDAPLHVRAERIADREEWTVEEARQHTERREASEQRRYRSYYNIDVTDRSIYDLAINTARWTLEAEIDILIAAVERFDPSADNGAVPIADIETTS